MNLLNKKVICTKGAYKGMSGKVTKVINNKAVQFVDEVTNQEVTDCHINCVELVKIVSKPRKRKVLVMCLTGGKGVERILLEDEHGYYVRHDGCFDSVVEKDGKFYMVPTPGHIHDKRNK